MKKIYNFIHGEKIGDSNETLDVFDPSKGEKIAEVICSNEKDFKKTIESSKKSFKEGFKEGPMGSSSQDSPTTDTTEVRDTSDSTKEEPEPPKGENEPDPNPKNDTSEDTTEVPETIKTSTTEQADTIANNENNTIKDEIYSLIEEFKTLRRENLDKLSNLPNKIGKQYEKYEGLKEKVESDNKANKTNEHMGTHYSVMRIKKPISSNLQIEPPKGVNRSKYYNGKNLSFILDDNTNVDTEDFSKLVNQKKNENNIDTNTGLNQEQIKEKNKLIIKNDFQPELDNWYRNLKNDYENKYIILISYVKILAESINFSNKIYKKLT